MITCPNGCISIMSTRWQHTIIRTLPYHILNDSLIIKRFQKLHHSPDTRPGWCVRCCYGVSMVALAIRSLSNQYHPKTRKVNICWWNESMLFCVPVTLMVAFSGLSLSSLMKDLTYVCSICALKTLDFVSTVWYKRKKCGFVRLPTMHCSAYIRMHCSHWSDSISWWI